MKIENVIFFGAGASTAEGAPSQGALFKDYFKLYRTESLIRKQHKMNLRLRKFFEDFFGIDTESSNLRKVEFPTVEEVLGILDISINRNESFKDYGLTPGKPDIQQLREDIIFLIAQILDKKLMGKIRFHDKLINRLLKERTIFRTSFISLNYDILLDNVLTDPKEQIHLDYGIEFTNFNIQNDWARPNPTKSVFLLKLHGSLNWLYCPTCISLTLTPQEKKVAQLVFTPIKCRKCKSYMVPIIIPPTFFKVMSNYFLQQIWNKAEIILRQPKRIIFCGYSFPDADIHIKYLMKRIELNKSKSPMVFIVNNHKKKIEFNKKNEKNRYKRFFKNSEKVHYTDLSFQDFCKEGIYSS